MKRVFYGTGPYGIIRNSSKRMKNCLLVEIVPDAVKPSMRQQIRMVMGQHTYRNIEFGFMEMRFRPPNVIEGQCTVISRSQHGKVQNPPSQEVDQGRLTGPVR